MVYPPDFTYPDAKARTAQRAAQCIQALAPDHRGVVQAGGCSGLWPLALSKVFAHVWTCEPAPSNWRYLQANLAGVRNITACAVALGAAPARVGLTRPKPNAGLWTVSGDGDVPMTTIDALVGSAPIDALVLDVEGAEAQALRGAAQTIAASHPLIWVECLQQVEAIAHVLAGYGYPPIRPGLGGDGYTAHPSRSH